MAFEFNLNEAQCLNCGACMDLCPPQCLDMTRPGGGPEGTLANDGEKPWMMAFPVQVAKCTGCMVCVAECPTNAITIKQAAKVDYQLPQGPLFGAPTDDGHWVPLSDLTHETLKRVKPDPWGTLFRWKSRVRPRPRVGPAPNGGAQ